MCLVQTVICNSIVCVSLSLRSFSVPPSQCLGDFAGDAIHPALGKGVVWFTRLAVYILITRHLRHLREQVRSLVPVPILQHGAVSTLVPRNTTQRSSTIPNHPWPPTTTVHTLRTLRRQTNTMVHLGSGGEWCSRPDTV